MSKLLILLLLMGCSKYENDFWQAAADRKHALQTLRDMRRCNNMCLDAGMGTSFEVGTFTNSCTCTKPQETIIELERIDVR